MVEVGAGRDFHIFLSGRSLPSPPNVHLHQQIDPKITLALDTAHSPSDEPTQATPLPGEFLTNKKVTELGASQETLAATQSGQQPMVCSENARQMPALGGLGPRVSNSF